jgi:hypothetical protein
LRDWQRLQSGGNCGDGLYPTRVPSYPDSSIQEKSPEELKGFSMR